MVLPTSCAVGQGGRRSAEALAGSTPPAAEPAVPRAAGGSRVAGPARRPAAAAGQTSAGVAGAIGNCMAAVASEK